MKSVRRYVELSVDYYVRRRPPIIVFSMRRTGSVAVYNSLLEAGEFALASHSYTPEYGRVSGATRWAWRHIVSRGKPARVIALVRNPVDQILSDFARRDLAHDEHTAPDEEIARRFIADYLDAGWCAKQLGWFDAHFKSSFGIDVYAHAFDKDRGFVRIRQGAYDALILRTELDSERKTRAIAEFIGAPSFTMVDEKTIGDASRLVPGIPGARAAYAERYRALKRVAAIPDEHWRAIVESKHARHFCTRAELVQARERLRG